jgi:hypothetical protein
MASKKKPLFWQGHPVRDEQHHTDLDLKAAIYEFHHGMDRSKAEERVKHEDRVERHQKAAAHHLDGMRAANAIGNHEDAQRHHGMYSLHVKALGHDPSGAVHPDVMRHREGDERSHAYNFKSHEDDQFLVQPVRKSEEEQDTCPWCDSADVQESDKDPKKGTHRCNGCGEHFFGADSTIGRNYDVAPISLPDAVQHHLKTVGPNPAGLGPSAGLIAYLKSKGINNATISDPPPAPTPPLKVFEGGGQASESRYGHLRVVKAEDAKFLKGAPMDKAMHSRVKQFDARQSSLRHKHLPEEKGFDYSAWLTPEQQQGGYKMFVMSHGNGNPVRVHVMQSTPTGHVKVGGANGNVDQDDLEVETYHLAHPAHHNKGIESSMLNAMMGHAKAQMGAKYLSHAPFTPEASAFIEAVAKPHGYELGDIEDIEDDERPVDRPAGRLENGGVKARSKQEGRVPRSFRPRINNFWGD